MKKNECRKNYISNIVVLSCDAETIFLAIIDTLKSKKHDTDYISITNTESMYYAQQIHRHLEYINNATFSLCDGVGSIIAGRFQGQTIRRFHGPDFMLKTCQLGQDYNLKHFFYGGKEGVADILANNLKQMYPKMNIVGTFCPPFRELSSDEEKEMIDFIKASKPDIIWVGLGLLKQERWIEKYQHQTQVPWAVGVGAAFDFYAGTVKRAPKFFQVIGLEWLYRLMKEPRMFKRNVNSFAFMFRAIGLGLKNKFKGIK
ncbi:MAG TPA: glycosyltransferase [Arcobacter sp.]|nr:glycosyltransferase [Arcobacter sp.]